MSAAAEARRLTVIGLVVMSCFATVCLLVVFNPFGGRPAGRISVVMDLPYVGQGVTAGSPMMMHGVTVGKVTAVSSLPSGNVQLKADLEAAPTAELTDTLGVDFRPANYFGVTGINLVAGLHGRRLHDGAQISTVPTGNSTLQALLSRMGEITGDVVTPQLVDVINRATRYTDGLNPLIESMMTAAQSVAKVQTVSTEQLLRITTGISVAFPAFADAVTAAGYGLNQDSGFVTFNVSAKDALPQQDIVPVTAEPGQLQSDEYFQTRSRATLHLAAGAFFGALGKLLSSHPGDLLPMVNMLQSVTDTVPGLITPVGLNDTLVELRTRFEKLYSGSPEQRALQVRIVLDQIPGVQAPINAMGGP
ncbi:MULTISPECIES: MlaD family protein [unclassified Mycolicibacterium]|uniref:MlaD family protein n=1 Tax=unclassified Mycolicibacterium TaxID=2636767 RepID=UPI0012DE8C7F|nr:MULTISPECIES: MlaD family protein [unclassified Mycolicibacterium]MUL82312.1 MCE family protein [Mycolicibacterium sp. CBMA 329]MUL88078.1 MCE family protein [Mycolicibacterium sp. CBMA 331]MUM02408.1 MCE family protein [Mycolicibacterium sp. CBMA 334]MUM24811.1 MCE family protein [Mycolicibacterium sp. CBMA 295]MUM38375.1 MCE family protein [Mycolicibacterium sp. CBMA 247]